MSSLVAVTGAEGFIGSHLVEALVRRGHRVRAMVQYNSFDSYGWLETLPPADPYRVRALSVESTDSVHALTAAIDRAAREKGWLVLVFHQFTNSPPEYAPQYSGLDFAQVMAHLAAADVDVLTFTEAVLGR